MQKCSAVYYCRQVDWNDSAFTVHGMTKDDEKATDEMNPRSTWEFVQVDTESNAESNDYGFFERRDANESLRGKGLF